MIETIIVLAPLLGAAIAGLLQRFIGDRGAMTVTVALMALTCALSLYTFATFTWGHAPERVIELFRFIDVAGFSSTWSVRIDALSATMLVVVTVVSFLVHVYSIGYMADDPHRARFFSYLSFFTFAMLALVTSNDFLQLFFGWEGVGVASYLLIGFWYQNKAPNDAAIKAFVVNRVGDFGFALGIVACFLCYGSIKFDEVFAAAAAHPNLMLLQGDLQVRAVEAIAVLLFIGAMGKSAQFFLHTWLPDAMEGPTPVSALIHAATMVTAGVFMVCRASELYELAPYAAGFVTIIGATTAFFAATVGLAQNDIKRVIAYSTCSQLGYMFFAAGVGAYNVAMFHLFTHAFFKALLFLGAGSVIHGMHHEQDMRAMGGLRKYMPITWAMMTIGTLALIGFGIPGIFGFAGFYSKDAAIEAAYGASQSGRFGGEWAFQAGIIAALLTSFYSWRLAFMTFEGKLGDQKAAMATSKDHSEDHAPEESHDAHDDHGHGDHDHGHGRTPHESPQIMLFPLYVLAAGAIFAGFLFAPYFIGAHAEDFWRGAVHLPHGAGHGEGGHHYPDWVIWAPLVVTAIGFVFAVFFYLWNRGLGARIAAYGGPLHAFLYHKWFFDEIYNFIFVKGARALGDLFWKGGDQKVIDGLGPDGVSSATRFFSRQMRRVQTGLVYHYSFLMLIAAAAFGAYAIWAGGARP
ncbi:MAG: NADH-quinone oxidoreductase subunit L [Hyphomonadaceae bacterium]|nr:NADH-quinone oxidoreductase subunit L [Hyphomonadaceae bacterium]